MQDIKNIIEIESQYYATKDYDKLLDIYHQGEETTVIGNLPMKPGEAICVRSYDAIVQMYANFHEKVSSQSFPPSTKSEWNINIEGNLAWCTFKESYSFSQLDNITFRNVILKKTNSNWKIINSVTVVDYKTATLNVSISDFPIHLQPLIQHWQNEKS